MNALPQSQVSPNTGVVLPLERPLAAPPTPEELKTLRLAAGLRTARNAGIGVLALLVVATSGLYWWTFQTQARWEDGYRQLVSLRTQSRQLALFSEALTGNLASSVALNTPLRVATPAQALSVPAAPERPLKPLPQAAAPDLALAIPAGY
ncbi:hypothetical protein [Gloeobacter violaceus]|uniref:Glr2928 protein n=1 Tax=Gloeobacter violaceus (strain ATCC 29082 / PCC 7421) TaxID=251221 RepID=Q7NCQ0_GLOVI|nr:hypothetical protein [Gloeobacter violaceus]BAC90869.1 glr2928 [Gloeobacter violaceus PCC 7421]